MASLEDKNAWIRRVLGVAPDRQGSSGPDPWGPARAKVLKDLAALEQAISAMDHPQTTPAIILLKSIRKNLPAKVDGPRAAADIRRYLETDDIITDAERPNGFGLAIAIRKPLLDALAAGAGSGQ